MSTKPTKFPEWVRTEEANDRYFLEPGAGLKDTGWDGQTGEKPAGQHHNWLLNLIWKWFLWFDALATTNWPLLNSQSVVVPASSGFEAQLTPTDWTPAGNTVQAGVAAPADWTIPLTFPAVGTVLLDEVVVAAKHSVATAGAVRATLYKADPDGTNLTAVAHADSAATTAAQNLTIVPGNVSTYGKVWFVVVNSNGGVGGVMNRSAQSAYLVYRWADIDPGDDSVIG